MKREVAVIDYGMCNLDSVARAIEECGASVRITDLASEIEGASHLVLPGVGAFADAMAQLTRRGLDGIIRRSVLEKQTPFLGICLGMQLMAARGAEGGPCEGLGLVEGEVVRLVPEPPGTRIPHVGWNEVVHDGELALLAGIASGTDFYFVHSYHLRPGAAADSRAATSRAAATTPYCGGFTSVVARGDRVFGVQFHPEKSQRAGFRLLKNFLAL